MGGLGWHPGVLVPWGEEAGEDVDLVARWERQDIKVALPELPAVFWSISWRWKVSTLEQLAQRQRLWDKGGGDVLLAIWRRSLWLHGGQRHSQNIADVSAALPCASLAWPGMSGMLRTPTEDMLSTQTGLHMLQPQAFQLLLLILGMQHCQTRLGQSGILYHPHGTVGLTSCPSHLRIPISGHCFRDESPTP